MRSVNHRALAAAIVATTLAAPAVHAHGMRTAYLELSEQQSNVFVVNWRRPTRDAHLEPHLPPICRSDTGREISEYTRSWVLRCDATLAGQTLSVSGLGTLTNEVVVRIGWHNGEALSRVLTPSAPTWTLPEAQSLLTLGVQYIELGVSHILSGSDHLLFLMALLLLVRGTRRLLATVTAFTLAHSVTLSATAVGLIHMSSAAAEACIALSLVLLALEVRGAHSSEARRWYGPGIAFAFGLVHGFGFANALVEIGLPEHAVPLALAAFNIGVELGQLAFVVGLVVLLRALVNTRLYRPAALASVYAVGGLGMFWFLQRSWALVAV